MSDQSSHFVIGDQRIQIFVPSRRRDKQLLAPSLIQQWKSRCETIFEKLFNGTAPEGPVRIGGYRHQDGSVTREEIRVVETTVSNQMLSDIQVRTGIIQLAAEMCHAMDQECIFVAWGAEGILVSGKLEGREAAVIPFRAWPADHRSRMMCICWIGVDSSERLHQILSLDGWQIAGPSETSASVKILFEHPTGTTLRRIWLEPTSTHKWTRGLLSDGDLCVSSAVNGVNIRLWSGGRFHGPKPLFFSYTGPTPHTSSLLRALLCEDIANLLELLDKKDVRQGFFRDYRGLLEEAEALIAGQAGFEERAFSTAQLLLGRLMFLKFIEQKGWLRKDQYFFRNLMAEHRGAFYKSALIPLFFDKLNKEERPSGPDGLPYLNGGLFQPRAGEFNLKLPDELFHHIFGVFDQYQFTMEETPGADEAVSVDPSMFGKVLESLADPEQRKKDGVHYTPRAIAHALAHESIIARLASLGGFPLAAVQNFCAGQREALAPQAAQRLLTIIPQMRIVDPAVGSGALLLACLDDMMSIAERCHERMGQHLARGAFAWGQLCRQIVCNCLYGVDLSADAIEIAKLRLWLAVAVSDVEPAPLPDLEFNVREADSLLSDAAIEMILFDPQQQLELTDEDRLRNEYIVAVQRYLNAGTEDPTQQHRLLKDLEHIERSLSAAVRAKPQSSVKKHRKKQEHGEEGESAVPFSWKLHFAHVFKQKGGFDIVIANPPYVRIQNIGPDVKARYQERWSVLAKGSVDLYFAFVQLSLDLAAPDGQIAYIMPNFSRSAAGFALRQLLADKATIRHWVDFGDTQVFPTSTTFVALLFAEKHRADQPTFPCICIHDYSWVEQATTDWLHRPDVKCTRSGDVPYADSPWLTIPQRERVVIDRLTTDGVPLGQIFDIYVGIQTSADAIFLFEEWENVGRGFLEVYSNALHRRLRMESRMLRTCVKGARSKSVSGRPIMVLWPYDKHGNRMVERDLKLRTPLAWAYLELCERRLRAREDAKEFNDEWWYRFGRNETVIKHIAVPKLIIPAILKSATVTIDLAGTLTYTASGEGGGGAWGLVPKDKKLNLAVLAGFLRSDDVWTYYCAKGFPKKGGWRGVDQSVLEQLPVPQSILNRAKVVPESSLGNRRKRQ